MTTEIQYDEGSGVPNSFGTKRWKVNGLLHRTDGPAVEFADGRKEWLINGKRHREDGPAIEWHDGDKFWYLNGERLTEYKWSVAIKNKETKIMTDTNPNSIASSILTDLFNKELSVLDIKSVFEAGLAMVSGLEETNTAPSTTDIVFRVVGIYIDIAHIPTVEIFHECDCNMRCVIEIQILCIIPGIEILLSESNL